MNLRPQPALAAPQPRNTPPAAADLEEGARIARRYRQVGLPDGTPCEVAREGDWVYVRLPGGKEGRLRSRRFDAFMREGRSSMVGGGRGAARTALAEAMRRSAWQLVGFVVLVLVVLLGLLLASAL